MFGTLEVKQQSFECQMDGKCKRRLSKVERFLKILLTRYNYFTWFYRHLNEKDQINENKECCTAQLDICLFVCLFSFVKSSFSK